MHIKRRHFLVATTGAAGALLVGWLALPPRQRLLGAHPLPTARGQTALNGWVKVGTDDSVTVMMSQAEMGQGAHTGLAMLLAEEMDAAWESVRLEQAPLDRIYNNQAAIVDAMFAAYAPGVLVRAERRVARRILREIPDLSGTGGSSSITDQWLPLREAGAAARALLLAAAAQQWQVAVAECRTAAGRVLHPSGRSARYGELVPLAGRLPLPRHVPPETRRAVPAHRPAAAASRQRRQDRRQRAVRHRRTAAGSAVREPGDVSDRRRPRRAF